MIGGVFSDQYRNDAAAFTMHPIWVKKMYVKANTGFRRKAFPGENAWKLRIAYSNKESESCISAGERICDE